MSPINFSTLAFRACYITCKKVFHKIQNFMEQITFLSYTASKLDICENGFPSFKTQISSVHFKRLSGLCINYISRDLDNTVILLYKLFVRYLVAKRVCVTVNAALVLVLLS